MTLRGLCPYGTSLTHPVRYHSKTGGDIIAQFEKWDGAKRPRRPLWGVAERSESFKIMIAGGNHTTIKSC